MTHRIMAHDECGTETLIEDGVLESELSAKLSEARDRFPEYRKFWSELEMSKYEIYRMHHPDDDHLFGDPHGDYDEHW